MSSPLRGVYFIQAEGGGAIKIGYANDCEKRLLSLQSSTPLTLKMLASNPGTKEIERGLHVKFAQHHIGREWFTDAPEIYTEIDRIKADPFYLAKVYGERNKRIAKASEGVPKNALEQLEIECAEHARQIVRDLAEPRVVGDNVAECIARAAAACGLKRPRVRRLWYGLRVGLTAAEYVTLQRASERKHLRVVA